MEKSSVANPVSHFFLKVGRRLRRRVEIDAEVRVSILSGQDDTQSEKAIRGRTINLSYSGALVILPETSTGSDIHLSQDPGEKSSNLIDVEFLVGTNNPISFNALAKVVWIEEIRKGGKTRNYHLAGLRFIKLFKDDQDKLKQILGD